MGKLFGTDGIRGVVGENLTVDLAFQVGRALTTVLAEEKKHRLAIAIGKDTRISSDMLEAALMAGICAAGGDVMPFGTIPTPAVAYLTVLEKADAGIVISASHNPYEHNGIKIFDSRGYKLSDEMEERIEELILSGAPMADKTRGEIGRRFHGMRQMKQLYVQHLLSSVDCDLTGMRALVDCANGAASATAPMLFDSLHLQADFIHCDPDGVNINEHCGSTHLESLAEGVVKGGYDLGIAFDGDADRCLLIDEKGGVVDGDKVMAVCALTMKHDGKLSGNAIVATVMSNLGLHEFRRRRPPRAREDDRVRLRHRRRAVGPHDLPRLCHDRRRRADGAAVPAGAACLGPARLRVRLLLQTVSAGAYQRRRTALRRREGAHHGRRDRLGTGARARGGARG